MQITTQTNKQVSHVRITELKVWIINIKNKMHSFLYSKIKQKLKQTFSKKQGCRQDTRLVPQQLSECKQKLMSRNSKQNSDGVKRWRFYRLGSCLSFQ